jgi:hypothetical protein
MRKREEHEGSQRSVRLTVNCRGFNQHRSKERIADVLVMEDHRNKCGRSHTKRTAYSVCV